MLDIEDATLREAVKILQEAFPGMARMLDRTGFRSFTGGPQDLTEQSRSQILYRAWWAALATPIGHRAAELRTDLVSGEGFRPEAQCDNESDTKAVQEVLDDHWKLNKWEMRAARRIWDLGVCGEMIRELPDSSVVGADGEPIKTANGVQHRSRLICKAILPSSITKAFLAPDDPEETGLLVLRGPGGEPREVKVVRRQNSGADYGRLAGQAIYLGVNQPVGAPRGITDFMAACDWIDRHDSVMDSDVERADNLSRFLWDVSIKGATPEDLRRRQLQLKANPPKKGAVNLHGDNETWTPAAVGSQLADTSLGDLENRLFLLAWGSLGLPEHWFSQANTVNRGSATEMRTPVFAWVRRRRDEVISFMEAECEMALQWAFKAGRLRVPPEKWKFNVVSRDPDREAYEAMGSNIKTLADGLGAAVFSELCDRESAQRVFAQVVSAFGVEVKAPAPEDFAKVQNAAQGPQGPAMLKAAQDFLTKQMPNGQLPEPALNGNGKA